MELLTPLPLHTITADHPEQAASEVPCLDLWCDNFYKPLSIMSKFELNARYICIAPVTLLPLLMHAG